MKNGLLRQTGRSLVWVLPVVIIVVLIGGTLWWQGQDDDSDTNTTTNTSIVNESSNDTVTTDEEASSLESANTNEETVAYQGERLAGSSAPLLDFVQSDYEAAVQSDKLVVLYFYANWCPICKEEVADALYPAFNELTRDDVVGFRVNYNDNQTDSDEESLAREFGIAYQHSKIFLKNGERVLKAPDSWEKSRYLSEMSSAAN